MEEFSPIVPPEEAATLRQAYVDASTILEYGAGGSTWMASQMIGKKITTVESDRAFALRLAEQMKAAAVPSMPLIHFVDIGPVGNWGKPLGPEYWQRFRSYPLSPWDIPAFPQPDLVLIDGRFRAACFAAVCMRATRPIRVLFDDYAGRPDYHVVERICPRSRLVGRMAEFHVEPGALSGDHFRDVLEMFFQVSYAPEPDEEEAPQRVDETREQLGVCPDLALWLPAVTAAPAPPEESAAPARPEERAALAPPEGSAAPAPPQASRPPAPPKERRPSSPQSRAPAATSSDHSLRAKIRRLRRHRTILAIPYLLLTLPVSLPVLLVLWMAKAYRRRRKGVAATVGSAVNAPISAPEPKEPCAEASASLSEPQETASEISGSAPATAKPAPATAKPAPETAKPGPATDDKAKRFPPTRVKREQVRPAVPRRRDPEHEARMNAREDDFLLYRIIGNDLEPRHGEGQSLRNVRFILENEPALEGCCKKWLLNRIYDAAAEQRIIELLEASGQEYTRLPFRFEEYAQIPFDYSLFPGPDHLASPEFRSLEFEARLRAVAQTYRLKNNYVMNNNGARNAALVAGQAEAKWVMPWDGNCFLSVEAWDEVRSAVLANRHLQYFTVPMARLSSNEELLSHGPRLVAREEPQILFRCDAEERFDPEHPYGRRPKVELLARLGVEGPWQGWRMDPWDLPIRQRAANPDLVGTAGWVARLSSGKPHLDRHHPTVSKARMVARFESIIATLNKVDEEVMRRHASWYREAVDADRARFLSDHDLARMEPCPDTSERVPSGVVSVPQ